MTHIGEGAFLGCPLLTDVKIQESVVSIGKAAFAGCVSLTDIELPDTIIRLESKLFFMDVLNYLILIYKKAYNI